MITARKGANPLADSPDKTTGPEILDSETTPPPDLEQNTFPKNWPEELLLQVVLAAFYVAAGQIGLALAFYQESVTLVWPTAGIGLAAVVLYGPRVWPALAVGAFLTNFMEGSSLTFCLATAVGNPLESLTGAYLLKKAVDFRSEMGRLQDVLGFVVLAVPVSAGISATFGVMGLWVAEVLSVPNFPMAWWGWWLGDGMGMLIVTPLLLTWSVRPLWEIVSYRFFEAALLTLLLLITSSMVYGGLLDFPSVRASSYTVFPFIIWATLRFGPRGAVTTVFIVASISIWGTFMGRGAFAMETLQWSLLSLHGFLATISVSALLLAATLSERKNMLKEQACLQERLDKALTKVLAGFLPICAECKSIRNEDDDWVSVEHYVSDRTGAQFTHGLCPPCAEAFLADLDGLS